MSIERMKDGQRFTRIFLPNKERTETMKGKQFEYSFGFTRFAESTEDAEDVRADMERITKALSGMEPDKVKALADRLEAGGEEEEFADPESREHDQPRDGELTPEQFEKNRDGFKKMGAGCYAEARAMLRRHAEGKTGMRSGQEGHAGTDPHGLESEGVYPSNREYGTGGSAWSKDRTNRTPASLPAKAGATRRVETGSAEERLAAKFAERHAADFAKLGVDPREFVRTYMHATPAQREQLCVEHA